MWAARGGFLLSSLKDSQEGEWQNNKPKTPNELHNFRDIRCNQNLWVEGEFLLSVCKLSWCFDLNTILFSVVTILSWQD